MNVCRVRYIGIEISIMPSLCIVDAVAVVLQTIVSYARDVERRQRKFSILTTHWPHIESRLVIVHRVYDALTLAQPTLATLQRLCAHLSVPTMDEMGGTRNHRNHRNHRKSNFQNTLTLLKRDNRRRCSPEILPATSDSMEAVPHKPKRSRFSLIVLCEFVLKQLLFDDKLLFKFGDSIVLRQQWCDWFVVEPLQISVAVPFDSAYSTVPDVFMRSPFDCLADWYDEGCCCACAQPPLQVQVKKRKKKIECYYIKENINCECVWMDRLFTMTLCACALRALKRLEHCVSRRVCEYVCVWKWCRSCSCVRMGYQSDWREHACVCVCMWFPYCVQSGLSSEP